MLALKKGMIVWDEAPDFTNAIIEKNNVIYECIKKSL